MKKKVGILNLMYSHLNMIDRILLQTLTQWMGGINIQHNTSCYLLFSLRLVNYTDAFRIIYVES